MIVSRWFDSLSCTGLAIAGVTAALSLPVDAEERRSKRKADKAEATAVLEEPPMKAGASGLDGKGSSTPSIEKLTGVWVEGPGYEITYGVTYEACAQKCSGAQKCLMIEYYKPEKKCNLYSTMRPRLTGGSSFVGIKSSAVATGAIASSKAPAEAAAKPSRNAKANSSSRADSSARADSTRADRAARAARARGEASSQ